MLYLLLFLLLLSGCDPNWDSSQKIARNHPDYYPELTEYERAYLIWSNIDRGKEATRSHTYVHHHKGSK